MNDEELLTQPEATPEGAEAETAPMNPLSAPMDEPPPVPVPAPAITPEAEPTAAAEPVTAEPPVACTKHTVVTYDGPSDTLLLRIKRGERFLVTRELDPIIDSLIASGHIFTHEE